jgi:radical SAM protein with 4Fe4S-binding SPASM domain
MAGKKPSRKEIEEIVSRIDDMDRINLLNAFIWEHPEAKKRLATRKELDTKIKSGEGLLELKPYFNAVAEAVYLQRPRPIAGQLPLFEDIEKWLTQFDSVVFSHEDAFRQYTAAVPEFLTIMLEFGTVRRIIEMAIWGMKNRTGNIVHINYAHSKALLMEEFEKLLDRESAASPAYTKRGKTREQTEERLKNYLKVWRLRDQGLNYLDIALAIYHSTDKVDRVKKQFYKTYQIIYGEKYKSQKFIKYKNDYTDWKFCDTCPTRDNCQDPCPKVMALLDEVTVKRKEKLSEK